MANTTQEAFLAHSAHFGVGITPDIEDYAINHALLHSRYIFTKSVMRIQYGYCTHCKERHKTNGLRHGQKTVCPGCKSSCTVKAHGISRKSLKDNAYFVYYEKSLVNPNAIVAKGIFVTRDYREDYLKTETQFFPSASFTFIPGQQSEMYIAMNLTKERWMKRTVKSEFPEYNRLATVSYSRESIRKAVAGTPFQYSTWESYDCDDMVKFFELYAKYPCAEYLTKFKCNAIVEAKISNRKTFNTVNWRGKTIMSTLRLNKQQIRELKDFGREISPQALRLYQLSRRESNPCTYAVLHDFVEYVGYSCFDYLMPLSKAAGGISKAIAYIKRQFGRRDDVQRYDSHRGVLITWRDYLADCRKLGENLSDDQIIFPINLFAAHRRSSMLVDVKENAAANLKIQKRCRKLNRFSFEFDGMFIRPAKSVGELISEGKQQGICIGTYADRYASGKIDLFLIRKLDAPDVPFYAMEIKDGNIIQTQGKGHSLPTPDVERFIEAFKRIKLKKRGINHVNNSREEAV